MNAGVCSYCFNAPLVAGEMSFMDVIEFVGAETEADCIEPLSRYWEAGKPELEQAKAAKERIDARGLAVSCYTLDSDFAVYDDEKNAECVEQCKTRLETAQVLGTDTIRLDPRTSLPCDPDEADQEDVLVRISESMAEVADTAATRGMTIGVENHGLLLGRTDQVARMVELVDRPNFGVNIDPTNFRNVFGEDHVEAVRRLAKHVVHVHAKDFIIRSEPQEGEGWRQIPSGEYVMRAIGGAGDAQWPTLLGILQAAGYDGTISLEISDPGDIKGSVAKGVANLKRMIREL